MTTAEAIDTLVNSYKASAYMEKVTRQIADIRENVSHTSHSALHKRRNVLEGRRVYITKPCMLHISCSCTVVRAQIYKFMAIFAGRGSGEEGMAYELPDAVLGAHQEVLREHVQGPGLLLAALRHLHHAVPLRRHRVLRHRPQLWIHPGE